MSVFESDLLTWLETIEPESVTISTDKLEKEIENIIREKRTITSFLGAKQLKNFKSKFKQKKQTMTKNSVIRKDIIFYF